MKSQTIIEFLQRNKINYKKLTNRFIIKSKFEITMNLYGDTIWELNVDGIKMDKYYNTAELTLDELLEIILAVYNENYEIVAKGILRKKKHLVVNTKSYGSYSLGKVIN